MLSRFGLHDEALLQMVELVANELVTNAVLHAGGVPTLSIAADGRTVTLTVDDHSATPPRQREPDEHGGRGLMTVEALSVGWGYVEHPEDGKTVWARIPYP